MFYRKISKVIEEYLNNDDEMILCIDGARQVGKSFIVRELASKKYPNYIEINMADDFKNEKLFENITSVDSFYLQVSILCGGKLGTKKDTIIFIDEIQIYPELLTLLKALKRDDKYKYICSGSELKIALSKTTLIPIGSIREVKMYPMDFEEFLLANSVGELVIEHMRKCFFERKPLDEKLHSKILQLFKTYLYVGGLPDSIKAYVETKNVFKIKEVQNAIKRYYGADAAKYDRENKLKIKRIYDLVPSNLENKVKRIQFTKIENVKDARYIRYQDEFDYLISSGIVLATNAISEPKFPLLQSCKKNLIKLYMNDVGILAEALYATNINAIINDKTGVNLGSVYETVVAQELKAHGHELYYYDNKQVGEVDFLIDDYNNLSILPIEIKSGSEVYNFRALPKLVDNPNYRIENGFVFSNNKEVKKEGKIVYFPIYFIMFV